MHDNTRINVKETFHLHDVKKELKKKKDIAGLNKTGISKNTILFLAMILIFTLLLYIPSLQNDILTGWDDGEYIYNEDITTFSLQNIANSFSSYYLGMYQPLAIISYMINHLIAGDSPFIYHFTNLLIHLINVFLVFILIYRLKKNSTVALVISLIFAIHPVQVEAVAWISTRSSNMYAMFYLAALITYLKFIQNRLNRKHYFYTLGLFVLSLLSKSMAVTLPIILLLFDWYYTEKINRKAVLEKIPFFLLSVVFGIITIDAASAYSHISALKDQYHVIDRLFLFSYGVVFYLVKFLLPVNLSAIYTYPGKMDGLLPWEFYGSMVVLIVMVIFIVRHKKYRREFITGAVFFIVCLSPVLPLFWSRIFIVSERYMYLASIGLLLMVTPVVYDYIKRKTRIRAYILILIVLIGTGYVLTTLNRIRVWESTDILLTDVITKNRSARDVSAAFFYRGNARDQAGNREGALHDYNQAIRLYPDYPLAWNNRGIVKGSLQDFEGALSDFTRAIALNNDYADAFYNRGIVHLTLQKPEAACRDWERAARLGSARARLAIRKYCRN